MKKFFWIVAATALCCFVSSMAAADAKVAATYQSKACMWYLPTTQATGWAWMQHGYSRSKSNMDDPATAYMQHGVMVLACDDSVTDGNKTGARTMADKIVDSPPAPPNGYTLPNRFIAAGHSAGALYAMYMGVRLVERNYDKFVGQLLLDPAARNGFKGDDLKLIQIPLSKWSTFKTRAILANANQCNVDNNVQPLLTSSTGDNSAFVGIKLTDQSSHLDFEGTSGGGGFGGMCPASLAQNQDYARDFASHWIKDLAANTVDAAYYPGGATLAACITANDCTLLKAYTGAQCGNGVVEGTEQCDGGVCCNAGCTLKVSGTSCRAAANNCDVAESCSGVSGACPTDLFVADGTTCATGKVCKIGLCVTPPTCGNAVIESGEQCDGGTCCDTSCKFKASTVSCRAAANNCDLAELCNGTASTCPDNLFVADATVCGTNLVCQAGSCVSQPTGDVTVLSYTGLSAAVGATSTYSMTVPNGATTVTVTITGATSGNPDLYVKKNAGVSLSTYDCRPYKSGTAAETCTNTGAGTYNILIKATSAYAGLAFTAKYTFPGQTCGNGVKEGTEACDGGACCTASCTIATTAVKCYSAIGACDNNTMCNGTLATCPATTFKSSSTSCRAAAGTCDLAENCTGSAAACPVDKFKTDGTTCTGGTCKTGVCKGATCGNGVLDSGESCDPAIANSACCATSCTFMSSSTVCRAAATGGCDIAEKCTGSAAACPTDTYQPSTFVCRAAASSKPCDRAELCNGTSVTCPADICAAQGTACTNNQVCSATCTCPSSSGW